MSIEVEKLMHPRVSRQHRYQEAPPTIIDTMQEAPPTIIDTMQEAPPTIIDTRRHHRRSTCHSVLGALRGMKDFKTLS